MNAYKILIAVIFLVFGMGVSGSGKAGNQPFTQAELDQMLAPVALYPDTVLSHVLIAATYPLEVVQAARWSRQNPGLRGEQAVAAVEHMDWDPSVKALVAFPELLKRMDEDIAWTQNLGDAFLIQENQVVETIQYLRSEAYASGHLRSNEHVRVVRETRYIYIEPARTHVIYVPYYDPRVVYVGWRWASHPPYYWHHPPGFSTRVSFFWGPAYHVAPTFFFSSFHWHRRQVVSVHHHHHVHHHRHVHRHFSSGREIARHDSARHWQHNPIHRRGVSYRPGVSETRFVQQQSGATAQQTGSNAPRTRTAQARTEQRDWAAERRANLRVDRESAIQRSATSGQRQAGSVSRDTAQGESRPAAVRSRDSANLASRTTPAQDRSSSRPVTTAPRERAAIQQQSQQRPAVATTPRASSPDRAGDLQSRMQGARESAPAPRQATPQSSRPAAPAEQRSATRQQPVLPATRQSAPVPARSQAQSAARQDRSSAVQGQSRPQAVAPRSSAPQRSSQPAPAQRSSTPQRSSQPAPTQRSSTPQSTSRPAAAPRSAAPQSGSRASAAPQRSPARGSNQVAPAPQSRSAAPQRASEARSRATRID